jgi:transposase
MPAGLLVICCGLLVSCAAGGQARSGGHLPERLRTQVAPGPDAPWRASDLRGYSNALKPTERVAIDPARQYDLLELIGIAQGEQALEHLSEVFAKGNPVLEDAERHIRDLRAKVGELTMERDFLAGALGRFDLPSAKR